MLSSQRKKLKNQDNQIVLFNKFCSKKVSDWADVCHRQCRIRSDGENE